MKLKTYMVLLTLTTVGVVSLILLSSVATNTEVSAILDGVLNAFRVFTLTLGWPWLVTSLVKTTAIRITGDRVDGWAHAVMLVCLFSLVAVVQLAQTQGTHWSEQQAYLGLGLTSMFITYIFTTRRQLS